MYTHNTSLLARFCFALFTAHLMMGFVVATAAAQSPAEIGEWVHEQELHDWDGFYPQFAALLHDGRVLVWRSTGGGPYPSTGFVERLWDPTDGSFGDVSSDGTAHTTCTGYAPLCDGSIVSVGGRGEQHSPPCPECPCGSVASRQTTAFSIDNGGEWTPLTNVQLGRWYPSVIRLGDGRLLTVLGTEEGCGNAPAELRTEIFDPQANDGEGEWITLSCGDHPPVGSGGAAKTYPHLYVLPDGRVFNAGRPMQTYLLDFSVVCQEGHDGEWSGPVDTSGISSLGTQPRTVMYRPGKIMKARNTTIVIDFDVEPPDSPKWKYMNGTQPESLMAIERRAHNMVLLPDGRVLAVGGRDVNNALIREAEWIDPESIDPDDPLVEAEWEDLAPATKWQRGFGSHHMALLLPGATVMWIGGENNNAPDRDKAEIFHPPYLFWGPRPVIDCAPATIHYGANFFIDVDEGDVALEDIAAVNLLGLGAPTHGVDQNQRFVQLTDDPIIDTETNRLYVPAPDNANIAPPGHYMLFLISDDGVPSEAKFLQVMECPVVCPDITDDGEVNIDDLLIILNNWGTCSDCEECVGDINDDCEVNINDLLLVLNNWGPCGTCDAECPPETVADCWDRYSDDMERYEMCLEWVAERDEYFPE